MDTTAETIKWPPWKHPPSAAGTSLCFAPSDRGEKARKEASHNFVGSEDKGGEGALGEDSSQPKQR